MIAENNSQLLEQLEHLLAENSSLKDLLNEYQLLFDKVDLKPSEFEVPREEILAAYAKVWPNMA